MQTKPCNIFRFTNSFYEHGFRACSSFILKLIINFKIFAYFIIIHVASNDSLKTHRIGLARPYICPRAKNIACMKGYAEVCWRNY